MLSREFAETFATTWIAAWNSHDLGRILSYYSENITLSSPFIATRTGETSGSLKTLPAIRAYWANALTNQPDLGFRLVAVYSGVASLVVHYQRHDGHYAAEHFEFGPDSKVIRSSAHYMSQ